MYTENVDQVIIRAELTPEQAMELIRSIEHDCLESDWRWLDCDACDVCDIRVCVDCGAEVLS